MFYGNLNKTGTGTGTVSSMPVGINCGSTCSATFASGAMVTLSANPDFASAFGGWMGARMGMGPCVLNIDSAKMVTATFVTSPVTVPNAPAAPAAAPGNGSVTVSFAAYSDPNAPTFQYTVSCNMGAAVASGTMSPITVTGLPNDMLASCFVTATNMVGTSAPSSLVTTTPSGSATFSLLGVRSRKTHGAAGDFDLPISTSVQLGGQITVEPRAGASHLIVFRFNDPPSTVGSASAIDPSSAVVGIATPIVSGNEIRVSLTGIPDNKRVMVNIGGVNGGLNFQAPVGFLVGDLNNSKTTTAQDIAVAKSLAGQSANSSNFWFDTNLTGFVTAGDIATAKARQGKTIP